LTLKAKLEKNRTKEGQGDIDTREAWTHYTLLSLDGEGEGDHYNG